MGTYTDEELRLATQVAYAKLGDAYNVLCASGKGTKFTIQELKETAKKLNPDLKLSELDCLSETQMTTWSISGVRDTNDETGFYACIIDTGNGNAIAAFRGSESMGTSPEQLSNIQHDWIEADIGILNSTETNQYKEAELFLKENADLLNSYDSVNLTGHSLGGNLAAYSTIIAERNGVGVNFDRCVSFDGPGFSDEFLDCYKSEIEKNAGKIDHYKWSFVGSMLKELPGEHCKFLKVNNDAKLKPFSRHSTSYIMFDENGNAIEGRQDFVGWMSEKFTNFIDDLPAPIGNLLAKGLSAALMFGFENSGLVIKILGGAALAALVLNPVGTLVAAGIILKKVAIALGISFAIYCFDQFGHYVIDFIDDLTNYLCKKFSEFKKWAKDKINSFINGIKTGVDKFKNWFKETFNAAYKAAQQYIKSHSIITADTSAMKELASKLWAINGRLQNLDREIDTLYRKVKWTDLWNLQKADFKIGWSSTINKCADYLQDSAARLEKTENDILKMFG